MRTLPENQFQDILDADQTGLFGRLPLPMIEKDIHLTDLLERLAVLEVRHGHFKGLKNGQTAVDDGVRLVFCGGTSLAKAHGVIERMSEDVDLKVVLLDPDSSVDIGHGHSRQPKMLKSAIGPYARLKALHSTLLGVLADMAFGVPSPYDERSNPHIRDRHRYWAGRVMFENRLGRHHAIRPELKVELIHRHPRLATVPTTFGYLHERVTTLPASRPTITMHGIDLAETVAEKTVSLLRRSHWNWFGSQDGPLDPTLVRHVYDVYRIVQTHPDVAGRAASIFEDLVEGDRQEFGGRDLAFDTDPRGALLRTLEVGARHADWKVNYQTRLAPLIYAAQVPTFPEAFAVFERLAASLVGGLPTRGSRPTTAGPPRRSPGR